MERQLISDFCDPVRLLPQVNGDPDVVYRWQPSDGLSCDDCLEPQIEYIVQANYELVVENQYGCTDSADVDIILNEDRIAYAPNVFAYNGQKENDRFTLYPGCIIHEILYLKIYDRWGNKVFDQGLNYDIDTPSFWDGKLNGIKLPSGVYTWVAELGLIDGSRREISGSITLL